MSIIDEFKEKQCYKIDRPIICKEYFSEHDDLIGLKDNPLHGSTQQKIFKYQKKLPVYFQPCDSNGKAVPSPMLIFNYLAYAGSKNTFTEFFDYETVLSGEFSGCWMNCCKFNNKNFVFHISTDEHNEGCQNAWNNYVSTITPKDHIMGFKPYIKSLYPDIVKEIYKRGNKEECFGAIESNKFYSLLFEGNKVKEHTVVYTLINKHERKNALV